MSRRARLERSLESSSASIHACMNSICVGVAVSNCSASTCRVRGSRRASPMIRSIIAPVDARRRLVSGCAVLGLVIMPPSCHRPAA